MESKKEQVTSKKITEKDIPLLTALLTAMSFPILLLLTVGLMTLDGFMFSYMWKWWISGTFGVQELTLIQALGISVIIQYFRNDHYMDIKKQYLKGIGMDIFLFAVSWILTLFI